MEHKRLCHMGEGVKAKKVTSSGVRVRSRDTCAREKRLSAQSDHKVKGGSRRCGVAEQHRPFFLRYGGIGRHRRTVSHRASPPLSVVYRTDLTNGTNGVPKHPLLPHETGKTQGQIQHFSVNPPTRPAEIIQIFQKTQGATKYKMQCCRAETRRFLDANLPCVVFFLYLCRTNTLH